MKAVIFDMDGVIIDSESIHADMKIRTLTHFGIPCSMEDCVAYVGRSAKAFFSDFVHLATKPVSVQEMVDYKHKIYLEYIIDSNTVYPIDGILDLLYELHENNIPVALASSADRKIINAVLTKFGLADCFKYILSGAELPASKPNPAIYALTAKALGLPPKDCVVIEDATAGIAAAKDAGAYCIAYDNPNSGPQDLSRADVVVNSINDINLNKIMKLTH
ncbi:MAG TPA: HAD-IA family hydrolase [Candidatus Megamonas gallistercoris]|nr:HAD-IA family hydrolase [Candidatus Megamonas gallistercoris]